MPVSATPKPLTAACTRQSAQLTGATARSPASESLMARPSEYHQPLATLQPAPRPPSGAMLRLKLSLKSTLPPVDKSRGIARSRGTDRSGGGGGDPDQA